MCDFREPEQYFEDNKVPLEQRKYNGVIHLTQLNRDGTSSSPLEEGWYLIASTGSFYAWCDGNKVHHDIYFSISKK